MMPSPPIDDRIDTRPSGAPSRQRPGLRQYTRLVRSRVANLLTHHALHSFAPTRLPYLAESRRHKRSAPTSSSHTPWPNPHNACGTAAAPLPAISCLGAFRPPAARARGEVRHCRQPKTCTIADISGPYSITSSAIADNPRRRCDAKRLCGLEIDDELELSLTA